MSTSVNVEFVIVGEVFDLNTITKELEVQPTEQWVKGEKVSNRKVFREDTCWSYALGEEESLDINNQLTRIVDILKLKKNALKELKVRFDIEYLFLITIRIEDDVKPTISIKSPVIELMNDIGAELDVDMYIF